MKRLVIALLLAGAPSLAFAQTVTGTVNLTGSVAPKCSVSDPSSRSGASTFTGSIGLGELAGANGQLSGTFTGASVAGASRSFQLICNTASPVVTLSATPLSSDSRIAAPAGYADQVAYTATVDVVQTSGSFQQLTKTSDGASASRALTAPLANSANNITVGANSFNTATSNAILLAGNYAGAITVVIAPAVAPQP